jgi:hypothetical protein
MRFPRSILIVSYLSALALLSCFWPATTAADEPKVQIDWADGPITARLGDIAEIKVPPGYRFTGKEGTRKFLELTHNPCLYRKCHPARTPLKSARFETRKLRPPRQAIRM